MGKEVRGKIPTTRVARIPPYGAGALENQPFPFLRDMPKKGGWEKGKRKGFELGRKDEGASFTDLARVCNSYR